MRHSEIDEETCRHCNGEGYIDKMTGKPMSEFERELFPDYAKACPNCGGRGKVPVVRRKLLVEDER